MMAVVDELKWDEGKGELSWRGYRQTIFHKRYVPLTKHELMKIAGDVAKTIFFRAAYKDAHEVVEKELSSRLGKLVKKLGVFNKKVVEKVVRILSERGFGKAKLVKYGGKEGESIVRVLNSFESEWYLDKSIESKKPVCDVMRGFIAGGAKAVLEEEMKVEENKCRVLGDEYCEFLVKPKD